MDYNPYLSFNIYHPMVVESNFILLEPLNYLIIIIGNWLGFDYFYIPVVAILTQFIFYKALVKCKWIDERLFLLVYIAHPYLYISSLDIVRQMLALSILFYAYSGVDFSRKNRVIFSILAAGFHLPSLLISVVLEFIKTYKIITNIIFATIAIIAVHIAIGLDNLHLFYKYSIQDKESFGRSITIFNMIVSLFLLMLVASKGFFRKNVDNFFYKNILIFNIAYSMLTINESYLFNRVSIYFFIFIVAYSSIILNLFNKYSKAVIYFLMIVLSFVILIYQLNASSNHAEPYLTPYKSIFEMPNSNIIN